MRDTIMTGVIMNMTETRGADMDGALTDARMGKPLEALGAPLEELIKSHEAWVSTNGAKGKPLDLSGYDLRTASVLARSSLTALKASGAVLFKLNLEGAWLQAAQFDRADLRSCRLVGADLRGANLSKARLNYADMRDCNLGPLALDENRSILSRLDEADFRHVDLRGADLRRASLKKADLAAANLTGANLSGTDLTDAKVAEAIGIERR
jgi:uncharacterized protein YjbI with pentapeptide repeats